MGLAPPLLNLCFLRPKKSAFFGHYFVKKVRFSLNILAEFGIIQTAIENLECKIDQLGVSSLYPAANYQ
jgi:hypothetical protein